MAKVTFRQNLVHTEWTLIADGDTTETIGVIATGAEVFIFIGDEEPELSETEHFPISAADTRELAMDIPEGFAMYARGERGKAQVAGYRIAR